MPLPSVGRTVHFYGQLDHHGDTGPFAAIIIDVTGGPAPERCTLKVFNRTGEDFARQNVPYDPKMALETWSWPPRVGE